MRISLIAALTPDRVIGKNNQLPWDMPDDMAYFRKLTKHKPVIMGRKTLDSMDGKPLPHRQNIIITRDKNFNVPGCTVFDSIENAFLYLNNQEEVWVIGGAEIYRLALPYANYLYLTYIDAHIEGDTFFPEWNNADWKEISREDHSADEKNPYDYHFVILERQ